ncbi:MAG: carbamoyltransferase HypF [Terracidiphilus sp.]
MADSSQPDQVQRREVLVRGVVQGVGFRPFVYRLALEEGLSGSVGNDTGGVTIQVEGPAQRVESFLTRLRSQPPSMARIDSITVHKIAPSSQTPEAQRPANEPQFQIDPSQATGQVATGIPADAATCPDCLRELLDPADRRYRYPFLNCTNCGPRFTITRQIPYDRPQTSMANFPMCPACQQEYDHPANRRFHAQPNACWVCGPRVWLEFPNSANAANTANSAIQNPINQTIDLLFNGQIVAIKGIGGFHLSVDATNDAAVMRLRERKHRNGKPLAVMVRDLEAARTLCALTIEEEALLTTPARPIVLARQREDSRIAEAVAPGIPWLGIFLPYAPLQHLLFADARIHALVMTSANLSEEPIAIDNEEAQRRLGQIADAFLMHDREILQRCDDPVAAIVDGAPQLIRRARGFVPLGVALPFEAPPLLAVGGHLKNVFALAHGRFAYQSQHLGDLENLNALDFFRESLEHIMHTFEIEPQAVVHDLHPGYLSTTWAKEWAAERKLPLIAVQHHHAHVAACMAEHSLQGPVIGLALDGTGYGSDGKIWGGEVLIANFKSFKRFAHLNYVPMPGGEKAIKEPWRMAFAHLRAAGFDLETAASIAGATIDEARVIDRMIERKVNAPLTSSLGRLFDAVAAVVLNRRVVDYEAQAAIELEGIAIAEPDDSSAYAVPITGADLKRHIPERINLNLLWQSVVEDLRDGVSKPQIAARFHSAIASAFAQAASSARTATGAKQVALSGGCMHNRRLARLLRARLEANGFQVYQHRQVSPGDGGLSYGQIAVAAAMLSDRE